MSSSKRILTWTLATGAAVVALASAPLILADGHTGDHGRMHAEKHGQGRGGTTVANAAPAEAGGRTARSAAPAT